MSLWDDRPLAARVVEALALGPASGQALASAFGVSRAAIWKAIEQLRAEGVELRAAAGVGYELVDPAGFGAGVLSWRCARPVHYFPETDSTSRRAFALAMDGAESGTLVVADSQTAGRGRLGRSWVSPPGTNLYLSLVLRPPLQPAQAPLLCLAAAVGVAEACGALIKWPNDVLAPDGRKVAGILAELQAEVDALRFVVLGIGVNVNHAPPDVPAASVSELRGAPQDRAALLGELVAAVERRCAQVGPDSPALLAAWRARSMTLGHRVRVGDVEGVAVDVRSDGALLLDGGRAIVAGDVEMVAQPSV